MPIPAAPAVLCTSDSTKPGQKGGTLIAESVCDAKEHRRLLENDGYRPEGCPHCGGFLHVLGKRVRKLRDLSGSTTQELICRYRCRPCGAVWQVLPGFIARHLHRRWDVVQTAIDTVPPEPTSSRPRGPRQPSTVRRWRARLAASASVLVQALAEVGVALRTLLNEVGARCTRAEMVDVLARMGVVEEGCRYQALAGWIHRIVPGFRLA